MSAAITQNVQAAYQRIKQAEVQAQTAYQHYLDEVRSRYQHVHEPLNQAHRWSLLSWDNPAWESYTPSHNSPHLSAIRVGKLALPIADLDIPAMVSPGNIFITGYDLTMTRQFMQTILLRSLMTTAPNMVRLHLVDPINSGANLATFLPLPITIRGEKIMTRPDEVEQVLNLLLKHIDTVTQKHLGNLYPNVLAYNQAKPELALPTYCLAWVDFPTGCTDRMAEPLTYLVKNGPRAGVSLVANLDSQSKLPRNFDLTALTSHGLTLNLSSPTQLQWSDPDFGQYTVVPDHLPPMTQCQHWFEQIGTATTQVVTALPFERIAIPTARHWQSSTLLGLNVPIGLDSTGAVHAFKLGQEVVHHALIGGTIGSGKSNLLHILITQLALAYSPEELQLYLVDFKEGVEFQDYLQLPHARAVALESEREFGLSMLRRLHGEMEQRGQLYKSLGQSVSDLAAYRQQSGQALPRLVLVMDEFQLLFQEDDSLAREAARLLEDMVRRGRVFGLHIILSSQSPAIEGMYRNRLYNQIGLRIAFRCRAQEAQAILGEGNDAAHQLEQQGEAIYNDAMGDARKNVRVRVALSDASRQRYLAMLQPLAAGRAYPKPLTFESRAAARLLESAELMALLQQTTRPNDPTAWLGQPIEIKSNTAIFFERYARAHWLVAGGDETQVYGLMSAALVSLLAYHAPQTARFIIADFARPESPMSGFFSRIITRLPHAVEVVNVRQAVGLIAPLVTQMQQRHAGEVSTDTPIYLFLMGLHRWRELRSADPFGQTEVAKQLLRLADEGPEVGIHLLVWADGVASLERAFKRGGVSWFDWRVVLHVSESDSNNLLGDKMATRLDSHRAFLRYEEWELGRVEKFKPYTLPTETEWVQLLNSLKANYH